MQRHVHAEENGESICNFRRCISANPSLLDSIAEARHRRYFGSPIYVQGWFSVVEYGNWNGNSTLQMAMHEPGCETDVCGIALRQSIRTRILLALISVLDKGEIRYHETVPHR